MSHLSNKVDLSPRDTNIAVIPYDYKDSQEKISIGGGSMLPPINFGSNYASSIVTDMDYQQVTPFRQKSSKFLNNKNGNCIVRKSLSQKASRL